MSILNVLQMIVALLLVITVILQTRGSKAGIMFGGGGESFRGKRGLEKMLFYTTIILAAVFGLLSILALLNR